MTEPLPDFLAGPEDQHVELMGEPTEADTIKRQDSDAAGWYRNLPYRPRP